MHDTDMNRLFERLWRGEAAMEEWSAAVTGGSAQAVCDDMIVVSTHYVVGNVTAIRTGAPTRSMTIGSASISAACAWN